MPSKTASWLNRTHYIDPYDTHVDQKNKTKDEGGGGGGCNRLYTVTMISRYVNYFLTVLEFTAVSALKTQGGNVIMLQAN